MSSSQPGFSMPPFRFNGDQQQSFPHLHHPHSHPQQQQQQQQQHHHHQQQHPQQQQQHQLPPPQQHPHPQQQQHPPTPPLYSHHPNGHGHGPIMTPPAFTTTPGILSPPVNPHTPSDRVLSPGSPGRVGRIPHGGPGGVESAAVAGHHGSRRGQESNDSYFTHHPHGRPPHSYPGGHTQFQQQQQQQQQQQYHNHQHAVNPTHRHTYPPPPNRNQQHAPPPPSLPLQQQQQQQQQQLQQQQQQLQQQQLQPPVEHLQSQHLQTHHHQRQPSLTNPPLAPPSDQRPSSHFSSPSIRPPTPSHQNMLNHHPRVDQGHPQGQTPEHPYAPPHQQQQTRHQHHASISSTASSDQFAEHGPASNRYSHPRSAAPFSPVGHPSQPTHGHPSQTQQGNGPYHIPESGPHSAAPRVSRLERPSYDDLGARAREDERLQQVESNHHQQGQGPSTHTHGYGGPEQQHAHVQGLHSHHQLTQQQQQSQQQSQQLSQQQQQAGPPLTRVLAPGQGGQMHPESLERIDPRQQQQQQQQQQSLHSNQPHPHHARQLSREQVQMRPQSPMNGYPLREVDHRQAQLQQGQGIHPDDRQSQYRADPVAAVPPPPPLPIENERQHLGQQEYYRRQEHQQSPPERIPFVDGRGPAPADPSHHPNRSIQPSPGQPVPYQGGPSLPPQQKVDSRFQHHRHPSGAPMREGHAAVEESRGRDITYPQDERLQQYPSQNLVHQDGVDPRRTPINQQRPPSAMESDHRGAQSDPRYPPPGPPQQNPPFVGHERRESYPQHPQEPPIAPPATVHPGPEERHSQYPSHMHHGSFDAAYNPVRHPQQEPYPMQPGHPQLDPREPGPPGQPPRHAAPQHPGHSPEGRQVVEDNVPFHHQSLSHQQQHQQHQQAQYPHQHQHQQPPQPQHQQSHQYYVQHQQGYDQHLVTQESEHHHTGRSSFSYPAPPPPPPSLQSWQSREAEPSVEPGRPIDPRFSRQDSEILHPEVHGGHEQGQRGPMERAEHVLPPERMMPGREPPSAIVQPHFHPNGQQPQFPAGAEMTRNGLVSPRDGVFNETPPGSTRSVSPDSQMDRKRGRRPKPKLDTEIVAVPPPSMGNSPNTLVPRAGPETLPEQPSGKKRGRKPKGDPKAAQRNWNSVSQDPHRQSFGHADAMLDNSKQDPAGHYPTGSDDFSDASRSGRRIEVDHGYSPNGPHERAGQDISHHDKRFMEDEARGHSDPRFERQPVPFDERPPPVSVEEFEHQQRLRTQQKEQKLQQEQHLQHQQHPEQHQQQYSHPPAPGSPSRRYENGSVHVHALELHSVRSPLDHERQCIVDGHEQVGVQSLGPAGKEPEMVHRLEAVVANALVNIQHENRFQSPDGASYSEGDPNKRLRLDSPGRSIEPHAGHGPHLHRPHSQQADPHPAQSLDPVAIGRQDLAKDEQDAVLLLQSMIDDRRAMEQADPSLLHQGQVHHDAQNAEFSNGYPPRPVSPRTRAVSQHRDSMQHQPRHPQDVEHMSVDPHQYDRRLQDPQMLSPHPPYGHGQAYPPPEPASFDPHHGSAGDDHPAHQRHSSLGNATQPLHSSQRGPETFHEHGGENNGVYHPYPTERDVPGRPRRSSGNVAPHTPNAVQHNDQWHNGSPAHGRIDIADTPYPALHRDMPMEQQHPHHHGQPNQSYTHSHAPPQGQWPVDRPDNRGPPLPPHGGDANVQQPVSQESNTSVGIIPTKTKGRGKGKARAAGMMSAEIKERPDIVMTDASFPTNERDYDPRTQQYLPQEHGAPFHPPPAGATGSGRGDIQGRLQSSGTPLHYGQDMKAEVGAPFPEEPSRGSRPQSTDSKQASSGKRQVVSAESAPVSSASANGPPSAGISERLTPSSLRFGSGVILVQKLNDASGYGTSSGSEGSTKFPPSQLSIKTGYDLSKTTGPTSSTFSPSTPLSAVATALAVKKKRPKLIDIKDEIIATSPGSTHGKGDPLPPPPPPTKGKGGNRGRKGLVLVGSTDADIERSNQITRSGGPAWMMLGTNAASNSSSSSNGVVTVGAGAPLTSPTAPTPAGTTTSTSTGAALGDGSGIRRRAPLSTSTLLVEDGKRKPKRIKIDDKDVRQVQRTSSTLTEATEADRKEIVTKSAENDELEEGDTEVAAGDGCSNGMGSQRRRLPEEDDEDLGEEEVGRRAAGNEAQGRRQSHAQSQSQTQQPQNQDQGNQGLNQTAGGSKTMKRKSNASLSGTQLSKKAKEKSKAVDPDVETMKANGKAETPQPSLGRSVVMGIPLKRGFSAGGSGAATPTGDTDAESDLAMEDDIKCPHIFGLDSESEHEIEEEVDDDAGNDDDDDSKSAVSTPGKANGSSDQAGSSSSSKVEGVLDPLDPLQVQGLKWVKTLGMTEKAWEETFRTYERVKRLKELKNRQPVRKRDAILAAILYIVCRDEGSPRTFSEICTASGVRRGDIGAYYRLMLKVLKPSKAFTASARDTDAEAFMTRWCESLSLPPQVRQAAIHVFSLANTLNLTSGKCPSSVGAAAIYLCIFSWNNARRLARCKRYQCPGCQGLVSTEHPGADQDEGWIRKEQKDVAVAVGVVSATLMGCFRNLAPESDRLVPVDFLHAAEEGV